VAALGQKSRPHIVVEADTNACHIHVDVSPDPGRHVLVARRRIVGPTMACVSLAAQSLGFHTEYAEDAAAVGLVSSQVRADAS
jgi:hypothetical protein